MTAALSGYNGPALNAGLPDRALTPLPRRAAHPGLPAAVKPAAVPRVAKALAPAGGARKGQLVFAGALPPARIPPEALVPSQYGRIAAIALMASIAVHALVLAVHFSPFDFSRFKDREPPLEVALVNAKSQLRPVKPDILAQANLDGGGNTSEKRHAKSPLPVFRDEPPERHVTVPAAPEPPSPSTPREMLTARAATVAVPAPAPKTVDAPVPTDSPTANEMMQKTLEAMRLEAQIAKDMDAYQKIPRRKHIGASAREYRFARYVEDWRMKVERVGNLNYPEAARANKLYGSLVLTVAIRADGSIDSINVDHSSGQRILDAAAVHIVEMAAPYAPFPANIRSDTDILSITRTWTFAPGDELRGE
jgi:protein TonB